MTTTLNAFSILKESVKKVDADQTPDTSVMPLKKSVSNSSKSRSKLKATIQDRDTLIKSFFGTPKTHKVHDNETTPAKRCSVDKLVETTVDLLAKPTKRKAKDNLAANELEVENLDSRPCIENKSKRITGVKYNSGNVDVKDCLHPKAIDDAMTTPLQNIKADEDFAVNSKHPLSPTNNEISSSKPIIAAQNSETVEYPIQLGKMNILSIGSLEKVANIAKYETKTYIWPIGFKSTRPFFNYKGNPMVKVQYTCEIVEGPLFKVTAVNDPENPATGKSCTAAWVQVLKRVNARRLAVGISATKTAISGTEYFGLTHHKIRRLIAMCLPGISRCEKFDTSFLNDPEVENKRTQRSKPLSENLLRCLALLVEGSILSIDKLIEQFILRQPQREDGSSITKVAVRSEINNISSKTKHIRFVLQEHRERFELELISRDEAEKAKGVYQSSSSSNSTSSDKTTGVATVVDPEKVAKVSKELQNTMSTIVGLVSRIKTCNTDDISTRLKAWTDEWQSAAGRRNLFELNSFPDAHVGLLITMVHGIQNCSLDSLLDLLTAKLLAKESVGDGKSDSKMKDLLREKIPVIAEYSEFDLANNVDDVNTSSTEQKVGVWLAISDIVLPKKMLTSYRRVKRALKRNSVFVTLLKSALAKYKAGKSCTKNHLDRMSKMRIELAELMQKIISFEAEVSVS